jgi:hypothetical protein
MQIKNFNYIIPLIAIILSACQNRNTSPSITPTTVAASISAPTPSTTPTLSVKDGQKEISNEIKQIASQYNLFIENEKKTGNFKVVGLPDGNKGVVFTNTSDMKVHNEYMRIQELIATLNKKYYNLYIQETQPVQPEDLSNKNNQYEQLLEENSNWLSQELKTGSTITIYSPIEWTYTPILIGDSYVLMTEKENGIAVARARLNNLSNEAIKADILEVQRVENSSSQVKFLDVENFPYYSLDKKLSNYETESNTYALYSQKHQIIEVIPKQMPSESEGSVQELEQKVREMIALISPDVTLNALTPAHKMKTGTYFFRWEDRSKFLDDGNPAYIQVGINGKGEVLNYVNTLPLAK